MPRKQLRLPVTTGIAKPAFQMSPEMWARVEKKYRNKIPDPIRKRIEDAIVDYLWLAEMESGALPLTSARDIISAAHKNAEGLLTQLKAIQNCDSDAHMLVGHLLRPRVKLPNRKPLRDHLAEFLRDLEILNLALSDTAANIRSDTATDIQRAGYQQQGQAWNIWVRKLRNLLKEAGLPCGINRNIDTSALPFVRLVYQLQEDCPQGDRRFKDTRALTLAMYRAIHPSALKS